MNEFLKDTTPWYGRKKHTFESLLGLLASVSPSMYGRGGCWGGGRCRRRRRRRHLSDTTLYVVPHRPLRRARPPNLFTSTCRPSSANVRDLAAPVPSGLRSVDEAVCTRAAGKSWTKNLAKVTRTGPRKRLQYVEFHGCLDGARRCRPEWWWPRRTWVHRCSRLGDCLPAFERPVAPNYRYNYHSISPRLY